MTYFYKILSKLDYISVREKTGLNIIKDLGIERAIQVMDPVFLLEKEEWDKLEKHTQIKQMNEKYLICYDFDGNAFVNKCMEVEINEAKNYLENVVK